MSSSGSIVVPRPSNGSSIHPIPASSKGPMETEPAKQSLGRSLSFPGGRYEEVCPLGAEFLFQESGSQIESGFRSEGGASWPSGNQGLSELQFL